MSHHLGYPNGASKPEASTANHRNGRSAKSVLTDNGPLRIEVPRDRAGSFEPVLLLRKHETASPASTTRSWPCTRVA